ncbi:hypothetical protein [Streptomyces sp. NL15-2K]|uniref:hypothetical protein n=1 Tax=Streptomyces sp. NL15-2K TaxID=376149 RepID=UPI000FF9A1CB|nr:MULTISPECIES: hypothetical protein [Actinomycetes]WKX14814.1 hypothetical protein Q4V64_47920 [Kutzneria buriramensis]GCB44085.1 hypothetical protein SNL152K_1370 [Streptomyces sp. NL15-2K]
MFAPGGQAEPPYLTAVWGRPHPALTRARPHPALKRARPHLATNESARTRPRGHVGVRR